MTQLLPLSNPADRVRCRSCHSPARYRRVVTIKGRQITRAYYCVECGERVQKAQEHISEIAREHALEQRQKRGKDGRFVKGKGKGGR